jgi:hypothetical protein
MTTIPPQIYNIAVNNLLPYIASNIQHMLSFSKSTSNTQHDEKNADEMIEIDTLLQWMTLFFEDGTTKCTDIHKKYKQELYNIYMTIRSDYAQYRDWLQYNKGIWILSYYRSKDTKALAKKIMGSARALKEGLHIFSILDKQ